jgi:hypothetical protein
MIGRDDVACPRHVLNNNVGISRDVLYHELADGTHIKIEEFSWLRSGDERDGLALIKRSLRLNGRAPDEKKRDSEYHSFHFDLRYGDRVAIAKNPSAAPCLSFQAQREI